MSVPNFSAALLILNPIVDLRAVNVAHDKTKLKIQTEAVPINCAPKDVSGLVNGTTMFQIFLQTCVLGLHQQHHLNHNFLTFLFQNTL